ncbi:MAG: cupin domain-containing protein [Sphaerochaetaceae bacterium]|nr:cupin domain-containing protein [Sphaerochaetaceae bacterium]
MSCFVQKKDIKEKDLGQGLSRKVLAYSKDVMLVEMHFDKGSCGSVHTHPHTQISYVKSGVFEYSVKDEKRILHAGESVEVDPDTEHGCLCIEEGILLDIFTPMRDEFI